MYGAIFSDEKSMEFWNNCFTTGFTLLSVSDSESYCFDKELELKFEITSDQMMTE